MPFLHIYNGEKRFLLQKLLARSVSVQQASELLHVAGRERNHVRTCIFGRLSQSARGRLVEGEKEAHGTCPAPHLDSVPSENTILLANYPASAELP